MLGFAHDGFKMHRPLRAVFYLVGPASVFFLKRQGCFFERSGLFFERPGLFFLAVSAVFSSDAFISYHLYTTLNVFSGETEDKKREPINRGT